MTIVNLFMFIIYRLLSTMTIIIGRFILFHGAMMGTEVSLYALMDIVEGPYSAVTAVLPLCQLVSRLNTLIISWSLWPDNDVGRHQFASARRVDSQLLQLTACQGSYRFTAL